MAQESDKLSPMLKQYLDIKIGRASCRERV